MRKLTEELARTEKENAKLQMHLDDRLKAGQRMESLGTMARGMAHEINNPLNVIINCSELIRDRLDPGAGERVEIQELQDVAERIRKVVQVMLRFSEPDSVHMTPTDPETPVQQVVNLLRAELDIQGISLDVQVPSDLPRFRIRRRQIEQVLINIIQNAADSMDGAQDRRIAITGKKIERYGLQWVRLSVVDAALSVLHDRGTALLAEAG